MASAANSVELAYRFECGGYRDWLWMKACSAYLGPVDPVEAAGSGG